MNDVSIIRDQVNHVIRRHLGRYRSSIQPSLGSMASESLDSGGKRLRAIWTVQLAQSLDLCQQIALELGAATEIIHNATLVHDDLQDGDTLRRGQPTLWKAHGAAQAINCGDGMFFMALEILSRSSRDYSKALPLFISHTRKVIEGQTLEFALKIRDRCSVQDYFSIVEKKTAALIRLPLRALLEESDFGSFAERVEFDNAVNRIGICFQIQDDWLDLYGNKGRHQKGRDIAEGKPSFFTTQLMEMASVPIWEKADQILKKHQDQTSDQDVAWMIEQFETHQIPQLAIEHFQLCRKSIVELSHVGMKSFLFMILDQALEPIKTDEFVRLSQASTTL